MKIRLRILALVLVCVLLLPATVLASLPPPVGPATFQGWVTINGIPAPDGTAVDVKIGGVIVASTTTVTYSPTPPPIPGYYGCVISHEASYIGQTVTF